jgi:O-acetyl-ADP-ribose deacetylase (regulator of RNase III)
MIELAQGDLLDARTEALVNAVNSVGVMGKGIALQFKATFPEMFQSYAKACREGNVAPGRMHVFDRGEKSDMPRWIINFPTKRHWREPSRLDDVVAGLKELAIEIRRLGINSIAIPSLGCGFGGLDWREVRPLIERTFEDFPRVRVLLFEPHKSVVGK